MAQLMVVCWSRVRFVTPVKAAWLGRTPVIMPSIYGPYSGCAVGISVTKIIEWAQQLIATYCSQGLVCGDVLSLCTGGRMLPAVSHGSSRAVADVRFSGSYARLTNRFHCQFAC